MVQPTGNATYVFEENWEELSKLTKAEIIRGKLQKDRIIHRENWDHYIIRLFKLARCFAKDVTVHWIRKHMYSGLSVSEIPLSQRQPDNI